MKFIAFRSHEKAVEHRNRLRNQGWGQTDDGCIQYEMRKEGEENVGILVIEPTIMGLSFFKFLKEDGGQYNKGVDIDISDVINGLDELRGRLLECVKMKK